MRSRNRNTTGTKALTTLLLASFLITSCGKNQASAPSATATPVQAPPAAPETPFPDRLTALEKELTACSADGVTRLLSVHAELLDFHQKQLLASAELADALALDAKTTPWFARVRALAVRCDQDAQTASTDKARLEAAGLPDSSAAESAARTLLADKASMCPAPLAENLALAPRLERKDLSRATQDKLAAAFTACGAANADDVYQKSELGGLHARLQRAAADVCSVDSRAFADESAPRLAAAYKQATFPTRAAQLFSLQLTLGLSSDFRDLTAACSPDRAHAPVLRLAQLETELEGLLSHADHCRVLDPFAALRARSADAESADVAGLLSARYRKQTSERYQAFRARLDAGVWACVAGKEENLKHARLPQALALWRAFAENETCAESRFEEFASVAAEVSRDEAADRELDLTAEGRAQIDQGYADLKRRMQNWSGSCHATIEQEKRRLEEEKRKEEERRKAEEQRKQEEERKQQEEQKRKDEEQRKQQEEQKRREEEKKKQDDLKKQEEERKRQEEQKRKDEEQRKKQEEQKRKDEEQRKQQEEQKRREEEKKKQDDLKKQEEERKRQEEQKRKDEEQRKKQEEQKRREEEKKKQDDLKKQEEERKNQEKQKREEWDQKRRQLTPPRWGEAPARKVWTDTVVSAIHARISEFNRARDVEQFCPGYRSAQPWEQDNCWLLIVSAVSEHESSFHTGDAMTEPNGVDSLGLLALSAGECPNAPTAKDLTDPVKNLSCGVNRMATLVGRDGVIDGSTIRNGEEVGKATGATAYWSTLMPRHKKFNKRTGKWFNHIGFKDEIIQITKHYRDARAKK